MLIPVHSPLSARIENGGECIVPTISFSAEADASLVAAKPPASLVAWPSSPASTFIGQDMSNTLSSESTNLEAING